MIYTKMTVIVNNNTFETDYAKMEDAENNEVYGILSELNNNKDINKISSIIFFDKDSNRIILTSESIQSSIFIFSFYKKVNGEYAKLDKPQILKYI